MEQTTVGKLFEAIGRYAFNLEQVTAERDALKQAVEALKRQNGLLAQQIETVKNPPAVGEGGAA